ncbi:thermosome subunit [Candidatus Pacearchaeota archaeon]|nr:thermosome subunit [Candidatus Pacearchaeota archaeon]
MGEPTISENVSRTSGKDAQRNNILAARIVADIVKTTLGPKGMDKMLVDSSGDVTITNDGVTILEEMDIEHPAAKLLVDIAKTQEQEVGDGTTTVALLAGKLLEHAEALLDKKIHPTVIIKGYRTAAEKALAFVHEQARRVDSKEMLKQIAKTAMTGKGAEGNKEALAELIVQAVETVAVGNEVSLPDIKIVKRKGEHVGQSELVQGIVLEKERANAEMPLRIMNASILLINVPLEIRNPESETRISVSTPEQLESFVAAEERYLKELTQGIIRAGASVVFCQKGIDDVAQYYLAQAGILACRRVPRSDMEKISRAISAPIISNLNEIGNEFLGNAEYVEEIRKGDESFIYIRGCRNPRSVTIVVRGGSEHVLAETIRALEDGLGDVAAVVNSGSVVAGGGAVEIEAARKLRVYARSIGGKEQLAIEAFAEALESIPETLAENAGLDPLMTLAELRRQHDSGALRAGLNLLTDQIEDTFAAGIIEPVKVKTQALSAATEVATLLLRIDDVLVSKGKPEPKENRYEGLE